MNSFWKSSITHVMLNALQLALVVCCLTFGVSKAQATIIATVTTDDGNGADAYINTGNATSRDTNFGNSTLVTAKLASGGTYSDQTVNRKAIIRFDISDYELAATPNAVLKLFTVGWNGTGTMQVWGLNNADAGEGWVEGDGGTGNSPAGEIDWNNAPANDGAAATSNTLNNTRATLLGSFSQGSTADGTQISFSDPDLNSFLLSDTDGLVTLMFIRTTASDGLNTSWASKEHASINPPTLEFEAVPEPCSLALMLFGTVFLRLVRGKRTV